MPRYSAKSSFVTLLFKSIALNLSLLNIVIPRFFQLPLAYHNLQKYKNFFLLFRGTYKKGTIYSALIFISFSSNRQLQHRDNGI